MVITMSDLDLKLKLFGGLPIIARNYGSIKPLVVREILDYGYSNYLKNLNLLALDKHEIFKDVSEDELKKISMLDFILYSGENDILMDLEQSLSLFLNGEAYVDKSDSCVYVKISEDDIRVVNRNNYENIVDVLKWQNYINKFSEKETDEPPMDEKARKFKERMKMLNKKVEEIKKKRNELEEDDDNLLDFHNILSSLASKSYSINELNIMDLTVYQVYSKFKRLDILDKYEINIKSMLAGAKDVKLKHWSSKLD